MTVKKKMILVVEDEIDVLNFASRVLELEDYHALQAKDGSEELRLAKENQVALVPPDLRLHEQNGWSLLQYIKAEPALSAIPVVMLTTSAVLPQREKAPSMGTTDYLVKPLRATGLNKAVASALGRKE